MSVGPFFPHGRIQFHIFPSYTLPCQTASHKMSIPFLLVRSLQALECCNEVSPKPSLLQAKQAQFPQHFSIGEAHPSVQKEMEHKLPRALLYPELQTFCVVVNGERKAVPVNLFIQLRRASGVYHFCLNSSCFRGYRIYLSCRRQHHTLYSFLHLAEQTQHTISFYVFGIILENSSF